MKVKEHPPQKMTQKRENSFRTVSVKSANESKSTAKFDERTEAADELLSLLQTYLGKAESGVDVPKDAEPLMAMSCD